VAAGVRSAKGAPLHFDLSTTYGRDLSSYVETTALNASMGPASPPPSTSAA
jgi:iron complex outermembrane receptor protein